MSWKYSKTKLKLTTEKKNYVKSHCASKEKGLIEERLKWAQQPQSALRLLTHFRLDRVD